jgi:hypothetical protein
MYDFEFLFWKNKFQYKKFEKLLLLYLEKKSIFRFNKWMINFMDLNYGVILWEKIYIMWIFLKIEMHMGMD